MATPADTGPATAGRRGDLPTGTVTFLFTDVEGSTRLLQELGDRYAALLDQHNALLRAAFAAHDGIEVATEGDAFFVVFRSAASAVRAAAEAQRALVHHDWPPDVAVRVRMGVHTGEGTLGGDNYVGIDVHRAARISAAGHGGQVLVSETTRALVDGTLSEGLALRDLGEHRLKDLARTERIHQLVVDGVPSDFPTIRSLDVPNNLPTQLTTFLGRRTELDEIARLLSGTRILTLTGPGGTGKTRLSLQAAAEAAANFPGGVYFVPLAPITDVELVASSILQAVGLHEASGRPPEERLIEHLRERRLLLLLDNFEQIVEAAPLVARILREAPSVKVLVTSRGPLRISGEQEFPVPPLGLPDPAHLPDVEALSQYEAVALFIERALTAKPDFAVTNENAPAVAEITARLDGLPLAIELAAARIKLLPPKAMLARLEHRLSLLESGARDLPARQRTLRGAIEWSYDLLDDSQRRLFARLSVFRGNAGLEEIERVCGPAEELGTDVLDGLSSLVDHGLLRQQEEDDEARFTMLETIGEYAAQRLDAVAEADEMRERHAATYLELAEVAQPELTGPDQKRWLDRLERDHDNIRAALARLTERRDAERALRLGAAVWRFWQIRGHLQEARERLSAALTMEEACENPRARSRGLEAAGGVAYWQGDFDAARAWYERALAIEREHGDRAGVANALYNLSFTYFIPKSDVETGRRLIEESVGIYRELGDPAGMFKALWGLGNSLLFSEQYERARDVYNESLSVARSTGDRFNIGWSLYMYAVTEQVLDRLEAARDLYHEALTLFSASGDISGIALCLSGFYDLAFKAGDMPRAARLAGAAAAIQQATGTGLMVSSGLEAKRTPLEAVRDADPEAFADGESWSPERAVAYALDG